MDKRRSWRDGLAMNAFFLPLALAYPGHGGGGQSTNRRRRGADGFGKLIKNCLEGINLDCLGHTLKPPVCYNRPLAWA